MLKACGRPLLDAIFGGTLLQAIKCLKCGHLSCIYEEFLDLSIPIPSVSSSKFLNGALKISKSSSSEISKHQKKKERALEKKVISVPLLCGGFVVYIVSAFVLQCGRLLMCF